MAGVHPDDFPVHSPQWFNTTHWTVVLNTKSEDGQAAEAALGKLCETYWAPIHAYLRRHGRIPSDAEDLTQRFFERFLEKEQYRLAQRERGRFRSFLLTTLKNFLINEWERASAQKRGGGREAWSLDELASDESSSPFEPADDETGERIYERAWAFAFLEKVHGRIKSEYAAVGRAERFEYLEKFLPGHECNLTYAQAAGCLGIAEGTFKSDMHRLKRRYREVLREEIAHTVETEADVDDELRYLLSAVGQANG